jgi:predicted permease
MSWFRQAWLLFVNVFQKEKRDWELDNEVRSYARLLSDEKLAQGMSEQEARRVTYMEIGGVEQAKEKIRDRRTGASLDTFLHDIRYGTRILGKKPGFTAVAIATLALGIGANTAIFSVINATLLTPIPVPEPDRVTMVWTENPARDFHHLPASVPDFLDWKASGAFSQLAAFNNDGFNIRIGDRAERLQGLLVTPEWFVIQGGKPVIGRTFTADEARPGHGKVVVLGWNFWNTHYQASPSVLGESLIINGTLHTILGVMPKHLAQVEHEEFYVPAVFDGPEATTRGTRSWLVVGRIAPGLSLAAAQQKMAAVNERLANQYPNDDRGQTVRLEPIEDSYVEDVKALLLVLFGAVGFVLLVACANIANLLLVRGTARRKEIAIRVAVGASRRRIVWQLLSESLVIAILGAAAGILPAYCVIRLIPKLSEDLPNGNLVTLNGTVLLFALVLAIFAAVFFGLLPALQFWKIEANQPLREAERGQTSRQQNRLGQLFVVAEIAFTLVLLAGAGLMLRSFLQLRNQNPGYDPHYALTMEIALTGPQFSDPQKQTNFLDSALDRLAHLPGVEGAAATNAIPGGDSMHGSGLHFTDRPEPRPSDVPIVLTANVSPDYFHAMKIPLQEGRFFTLADNAKARPAIIVDQITSRKYWPHSNPLGQEIRMERKGPSRTIVGIVGAVEQNAGLKLVMGEVGQVYVPLAQSPRPGLSLVVRSHTDPAGMIPAIRRTVADLDRDVPLYKIQTLEEARAQGRASARLGAVLLSLFGLIALLLASIGVFGVISYTAGQRIREFGIRLAIGAGAWDLLKLTLGRGAFLVGAGAALGLLGAVSLTRVMSSLLTGISPNDPLTFGAATLVLLGVGLLASYIPARRASKVDPTIALRAE